MYETTANMIERLKSEVLITFGEDLLYTKDCKFLADKITEETGSRISTTTIRRLYGFLKTTSEPGRFTLETLSHFVGFQSWSEFKEYWSSKDTHTDVNEYSWAELQKRTLEFSKETYQLITGQSGIPFASVARRKHAEERIEKFLQSDKTATSFIAPGGFGKSTLLAKWYENACLKNQSNNAVLFLNAGFMISFLSNDFKLDTWLQDHIKFNQKESLKHFLSNEDQCEGELILLIDALDEITYDAVKLERLFLQLNQFILNYKNNKKVKIIITSRNSTWDKFALPFISRTSELTNCWFDLNTRLDEMNQVNLTSLTEDEIQYVFDRSINLQHEPKLNINELSLHQRKTISNPFFLELFIKRFTPNKRYQLDKEQELVQEYLKNKIFYSRYSEEKMDIIQGILNLIKYGKKGTAAKKIELREKYPIHLKSGGNYYLAYEEMVSYGLLSEFITVNEYASYCKYVKVTNEVLFETLIALYLIEQNKELNFDLILKVESEYEGYEIKNRLIEILLEQILISGKHSELTRIFELNDDSLQNQSILATVINSSHFPEKYRVELIEKFANNKRAEEYLFKNIPLYSHLSETNKEVLRILARRGCSKDLRIKSLGLLLRNAVLSYDIKSADGYFESMQEEVLDTTCSGFAISIKVASSLLYKHFTDKDSDELDLLKLFYYREMAYVSYGEYEKRLDGEFEVITCMALMFRKSYHKVIQLVEDFEHLYPNNNTVKSSVNYRFLRCYSLLAQHMLGMTLADDQKEYLLESSELIEYKGNTYFQIYYQSFLLSYYFEREDRDKVEGIFNKVIAFSEYTGYKLCVCSVLKKMAHIYNEWNEYTKEKICLMEISEIENDEIISEKLETILV